MPMDAKALTAAVKELNEANTAGKTDVSDDPRLADRRTSPAS